MIHNIYLSLDRSNNFISERESCIDNQKQNFGTSLPYHTQCRPEDGLTRRGGVSICRQCALTCDVNDFSLCFSAETGFPTTGGNGVAFDILGDAPCGSGGCTYGRKFYDADLLGAPTDADGQQMLDENNIRYLNIYCKIGHYNLSNMSISLT